MDRMIRENSEIYNGVGESNRLVDRIKKNIVKNKLVLYIVIAILIIALIIIIWVNVWKSSANLFNSLNVCCYIIISQYSLTLLTF